MGRGITAGTLGIVILAILVGLVGAYAVRSALMRVPAPEVRPPTLSVPLASIDLPADRTVLLGDIALVNMTQDEINKDPVRFPPGQVMMDPEQIIGRILRREVRAGQPFLTTALYPEGQRRDYTADLRPGQRAFSLQVPRGRGGELPIGTVVDVVFRAEPRRPAEGLLAIPEVTVRLLEGIKIIDVYTPPPPRTTTTSGVLNLAQRAGAPRTPPSPTVTLAVTPEQAEIIQTTVGRGEMTLVARPPEERVAAVDRRKGLTLEDVLGIQPPPPVVLFATELYRRTSRSVNVFRDDKLVEQIRAEQERAIAPIQAQPPAAAPPTPMPPISTPTPPAIPPPAPAPLAPLPGPVAPATGIPAPIPPMPR